MVDQLSNWWPWWAALPAGLLCAVVHNWDRIAAARIAIKSSRLDPDDRDYHLELIRALLSARRSPPAGGLER